MVCVCVCVHMCVGGGGGICRNDNPLKLMIKSMKLSEGLILLPSTHLWVGWLVVTSSTPLVG